MTGFRIEIDAIGEVSIPADAHYGAQTQRAVENFPISGMRFPDRFIRVKQLSRLPLQKSIRNSVCSRLSSAKRSSRLRMKSLLANGTPSLSWTCFRLAQALQRI